jgi:hypothetical protein
MIDIKKLCVTNAKKNSDESDSLEKSSFIVKDGRIADTLVGMARGMVLANERIWNIYKCIEENEIKTNDLNNFQSTDCLISGYHKSGDKIRSITFEFPNLETHMMDRLLSFVDMTRKSQLPFKLILEHQPFKMEKK